MTAKTGPLPAMISAVISSHARPFFFRALPISSRPWLSSLVKQSMSNAKMVSSPRLVAYGDESVTPRVAAFAFFVVRSDREIEVEQRIEGFKREAGIPLTTLMHCREMFGR